MNDYPKVTVLLATYNRAHLIGETLESIITQTYTNWECIIIDDNSTDQTSSFIQQYLDGDKRFTYYLKTHNYKKGLSGSRNMGLDIASERNAEFIQFFDDDDIMHPQKFELQMLEFHKEQKANFSICRFRKFTNIDEIDFDLNSSNFPEFKLESKNLFNDFLYSKVIINSCGPIFKSELAREIRFDESLSYAEERDFFLKVFLSYSIVNVPVNYVLFWYRKHDLSITKNLYSDKTVIALSEARMRANVARAIVFSGKIKISNIKFVIRNILK